MTVNATLCKNTKEKGSKVVATSLHW